MIFQLPPAEIAVHPTDGQPNHELYFLCDADAAEQFGGFWIIEAPSIDDATEWAKKAPVTGGAIEVRQLV
jgi:uncharacterized protein YciI